MLQLGITLTIPDTSKLSGKTVIELLKFYHDEIGQQILDRIEARTPVLTGALREDEAFKPGETPEEIVQWYVGEDYQDAEWSRFYAPYQEGGALGLSTYTNGPHEMFARVATDDLILIQAWANKVVAEALDNIVGEANANTLSEVIT